MKREKIPVIVSPFFLLFAAMISLLSSNTFSQALVWFVIIFVSVFFHEVGHALIALCFKQKVRIEFVALGGVTSYKGAPLKFGQQFLIVLSGPVFGFLLSLFAYLILSFQPPWGDFTIWSLTVLMKVNLFWSVVNLFPVLPLDGGQLFRIALEGFWGVKGLRISILIGSVFALVVGFYGFLNGYLLGGAFFFLFAFQGIDSWRKLRNITSDDRKEKYGRELEAGERAFRMGEKEKARKIFEDLCLKTQKGLLHAASTYFLALLDYDEGKKREAYEMLLSVREFLEDENLCLLHKLAFEQKDFHLVAELSATCYQIAQTEEIALHNAYAFAALKDPKASGGWLENAIEFGNIELEKIIQEGVFDGIRDDPNFREFFQKT